MAKRKKNQPSDHKATKGDQPASQGSGRSPSSPGAGPGSNVKRGKQSWSATHGRDLRFLGLFALSLVIFYGLTLLPFSRSTLFPGYLRLNAQVSGSILNGLGEDIKVIKNSLISRRFSLSIERGCDAVEPAALFCAAVLASPVALSARLLAVVLGTSLLMVLNLLRILSLYYVGVHFRKAFDIVHLDIWQFLFIALALLFWALWASWATQRQKRLRDAAT